MEYSKSNNRRLYNVWKSMRQRCKNPNDHAYRYYGGKGVAICDEWNDFKQFAKWAYENGYQDDASNRGCTLDRIDTDGDYCPSNCRWVTMKEQSRNKSSNRILTFDGKSMTLTDWANYLGMSVTTLHSRIVRGGWTVEQALTQKPRTIKTQLS